MLPVCYLYKQGAACLGANLQDLRDKRAFLGAACTVEVTCSAIWAQCAAGHHVEGARLCRQAQLSSGRAEPNGCPASLLALAAASQRGRALRGDRRTACLLGDSLHRRGGITISARHRQLSSELSLLLNPADSM